MPSRTASPAPAKGSQAARHAFLYLTSFATLGFLAFNIGILCFQFINYFFPEPFSDWQYQVSQDALRFAIATVFIAAPVFYFVTHTINRNIAEKDLDMDSGIRKWLTYIVLFLTIGTVIGDLVAVIYSFLNGDLTIRFGLQLATILVIAGGIFLYYFTDIKNESKESRRMKNNIWAGIFWIVVLIPFLGAFFILENPRTTRLKRIDDQTIGQLETVRSAIQEYYNQKGSLPTRIEEADSPQYYVNLPLEALREKNFEYAREEGARYRLCADFERSNAADEMDQSRYFWDPLWKHEAGHYCFSLEATPQGGWTRGMMQGGEEVLLPLEATETSPAPAL